MAHSALMQKLLRLTNLAHKSKQNNIPVKEFSEASEYYSRRNFLQLSAKAAIASTVLSACSKAVKRPGETSNSSANPSIAIVGGGIAGLHASYVLKHAGVNSTVYDAATRSGGRIVTAQNLLNDGLSMELGGEFIDSSHTDMISLAKTFGLPLLDLYSPEELQLTQNIYYFNGVHYTDADFVSGISAYLPKITRDANKLSNKITYNSFSSDDAHFDSMNIEQYFDSIQLSGFLREILLIAYLGEYGLNVNECNAINFLYMFGLSPEGSPALYGESDQRFRVSGGNQRIVDELANRLKGQINLNHKLLKLQQNTSGYTLYFGVNRSTTKSVKADIVLLTLPFILLREVEINAELSPVKRNAIEKLGYGSSSKLLLGFNGRPWRTQYNCNGLCYTDNGVQNGWDGSQCAAGVNGGYTIYLGGDEATALGNGSLNYQVNKYLPLVDEIYPGISGSYNSKASRMVWSSHPYAKAGYSAWTVGQYTTIAGSEVETAGNIFFAGEHTSYNYQGYMNGGASSGRLAAKRILKIMNINNSMPESENAMADY